MMSDETLDSLLQYFGDLVTDNKKDKIREVLNFRTNHITIALEDIYQPHNASATLRTCDLLGVQNIHIIENWNRYSLNPEVDMGSSKWISLHRYNEKGDNNTERCIHTLREQGYRIVATTPHRNSVTLDELPLDQKSAFLFGNEKEGLSESSISMADAHLRLPMFGFTESYNISVSVAITLSSIVPRLHRSEGIPWRLSERERKELTLGWYKRIVSRSDLLEQRFLEGRS